MTRPIALTPDRQEKLLEAIRAGNYIQTACTYAGISKQTYYNWKHTAETPDAPEWAVDLFDAIENARAQAEVRNVALIQRAATTQWQAAAWWLERSFPQQFGRINRVEMSGPEGGPIEHRDTDTRAALLALLETAAADEDPDEDTPDGPESP